MVAGTHFTREDSPYEIGPAVSEFVRRIDKLVLGAARAETAGGTACGQISREPVSISSTL